LDEIKFEKYEYEDFLLDVNKEMKNKYMDVDSQNKFILNDIEKDRERILNKTISLLKKN
jgi:hypothetical protein